MQNHAKYPSSQYTSSRLENEFLSYLRCIKKKKKIRKKNWLGENFGLILKETLSYIFEYVILSDGDIIGKILLIYFIV